MELQRAMSAAGNFSCMPLRDLPTESKDAAALLRTEEITYRRTIRRTGWHGVILACLAAGTAFSVLLPGSAGTGCYLWRATTQPVGGRGATLALPVATDPATLSQAITNLRRTG
jgi:hypothetical protein